MNIVKISNIFLWILQIALAGLFLFAGGMKLVLSPEVMKAMGPPNQVQLPGLFLQFIGVCELLGALGLILPGLFRIRPGLTPLAAFGLFIIMIGAAAVTMAGPGLGQAIGPFVFALLLAFVAYGRWKLAPHRSR
jgi:uncharacterized membrane protein YphA (DoxX/SURF4 family)